MVENLQKTNRTSFFLINLHFRTSFGGKLAMENQNVSLPFLIGWFMMT